MRGGFCCFCFGYLNVYIHEHEYEYTRWGFVGELAVVFAVCVRIGIIQLYCTLI